MSTREKVHECLEIALVYGALGGWWVFHLRWYIIAGLSAFVAGLLTFVGIINLVGGPS